MAVQSEGIAPSNARVARLLREYFVMPLAKTFYGY